MFLEVLKKTDPMISSVKYLYCMGILKLQLNCSKEFCLEHTINSIPIQFFYFFFAVTQGNERKCLVTSNEFTPFAHLPIIININLIQTIIRHCMLNKLIFVTCVLM